MKSRCMSAVVWVGGVKATTAETYGAIDTVYRAVRGYRQLRRTRRRGGPFRSPSCEEW